MAGETSDLATVEPFEIVDRPDDPAVDPLRLELTLHPAPDEATGDVNLPHEPWVVDNPDEHVNPEWEGLFEVLAGELRVTFEGTDRTLTAGDDGFPNPLQFAVIQDAYPGYFYSADRPVGVQKALFAVLAPVGRLAGYRERYSREEIEQLR